MRTDAERALRNWKWIAGLALASFGLVLVALAVALVVLMRPSWRNDERLLGTWQSDADRTITELRPLDEKQEAALRKLFGKLRVTYAASTMTTELDGVAMSYQYQVLGRDKHSVAFRGVETKPSAVGEFMAVSYTHLTLPTKRIV